MTMKPSDQVLGFGVRAIGDHFLSCRARPCPRARAAARGFFRCPFASSSRIQASHACMLCCARSGVPIASRCCAARCPKKKDELAHRIAPVPALQLFDVRAGRTGHFSFSRAVFRSDGLKAVRYIDVGGRACSRVSHEPPLKMSLHVGPLASEDAVHHGVAHRAVAPRPMMANHPILLRTQPLDRPLRGEIEIVGAQTDHLAAQRVEGVREQQQLAGRVDVAALPALCIPGVADLDAIDRGTMS